MRAIYLAAALTLSALAFTPASAAPVAPLNATAIDAPVTLAQYSHRTTSSRHYTRSRSRYVPGHRYRSAPNGWHRYHARPRNWHTRGCVLVGPVWFCP
jgi:hypothetical protein